MISLHCFRKNCIASGLEQCIVFESTFPFFQVPNTSPSALVRRLNGGSSLLFIKYFKLFLSSFSTHLLRILHKNIAKNFSASYEPTWIKNVRARLLHKKEMNWKPALSQYLQFVYFVPAVKLCFQQPDYSFPSSSAFLTEGQSFPREEGDFPKNTVSYAVFMCIKGI